MTKKGLKAGQTMVTLTEKGMQEAADYMLSDEKLLETSCSEPGCINHSLKHYTLCSRHLYGIDQKLSPILARRKLRLEKLMRDKILRDNI